MAKNVMAEFVMRQVRDVLLPYSDAELTDVRDGVAYVLYKRGHNPTCPTCEFAPEDLRDYLLTLFSERPCGVAEVKLEVQEQEQK